MDTHRLLAVGLGLLCPLLAAWGEATAPPPPTIPEMDSARVQVEWKDLRGLFEELYTARLRESREKSVAPPPPPFAWALSEARYDAWAEAGNSMRVRAEFDIQVLGEDCWAKVPILKNNVAPVSALLNGEPASLSSDNDSWLFLTIPKPGSYTFETTFYTEIAAREGVLTAEFPCARTPITHMTLHVPTKDVQVAAPEALYCAVAPVEDGVTATLAFRSTDAIAVQWTLPAVIKEREELAARQPDPPRIAASAATLALITDGYLACRAQARFDILHGTADRFTIVVPQGVNVLEVSGQGAAWSVVGQEDGQHIEVRVNHAVEGGYDVDLHFELPIDEEARVIAVPAIRFADVVRQAGFLGLAARSNVEVAPAEGIENLTRIDITELPTNLRAMSSNPLLLGYRYVGDRYTLPIEVRRLQDVAVRVASIDRAMLVTMVTEEGAVLTRARYDVRNNIKQFLRVSLPEGAEIWSAEVGGQVVKPARDGDRSAVLIPLYKSVETGRVLDTFPVELVYIETMPGNFALYGKRALEAPATDILANEVAWQVLMPESQRVFRSSGDLKAASGAPGATRAVLDRGETSVSPETLYRLREGIERFFITDINNPAASAAISGRRYQGDSLREAAVEEVEVAGVLPVRIDLPTEGVSYLFRRLMAPEGEGLRLTLHVYNARWAATGRRALTLAGFAVALLAGWTALRLARDGSVSLRRLIAVALLFAGVFAARAALGASPWVFTFWTALAVCVGAVLPWLQGRLRSRANGGGEVSGPEQEA